MKFLKLMFLVMFLAAGVGTWAQQPQTQTAPTVSVNAKYVNGVAPGYAPTAGAGLILNLSSGTANCYGTIVTYAGGTLTMTASSTNAVYLNTSASCVPAKGSGFGTSNIPLAIVTTSSSAILSISDVRTPFTTVAGNVGGSVTNFILGTWPSWLTPGVTLSTTTPTLAVATTAGQTSHQVIGTCGTATSFAACLLQSGDIPSVLTGITIDGVTPTTMAYVDATSSIQTQLNGKQVSLGYVPAHSGANSDITSLSGLTTALSAGQGGTGATTLTGVRYANGGSADTAATAAQIQAAAGTTLNRSIIHASFNGGASAAPLGASQVFGQFVTASDESIVVPNGCTNSTAKAATAATASTTLTIYNCSAAFGTCSSVGTIAFAGSGTSGTFTCSAGFTVNSGLYISGPATPDATLTNIVIGIEGVHN